MTLPRAGSMGRVLLTDHPWPGVDVESDLCRAAGYDLVVAPLGADEATLADLARDVDGILTCWARVSAPVVEAGPRLRVITRLGVGLDNIDLDAATARQVTVTRVPDYCVDEVSDHVVALVHAWARGVVTADRDVRAGRWDPGVYRLQRVRDLVVGIWGVGTIGRRSVDKFAALGCRVLVDDRHPERAPANAEAVTVERLLTESDVISLHLPLTPATTRLVDAPVLARMKSDALLVNTSRGALIDADALARGLDRGRPGAAALDVQPDEPTIPAGLRDRPEVIFTPHLAFSSEQSVIEVRYRATEDLLRVLAGEAPRHPV